MLPDGTRLINQRHRQRPRGTAVPNEPAPDGTHGTPSSPALAPRHLQLGRLGLQRGVVLLQEGALLLQRQDLAAEGHVLGLQVLQLVPEQLLLGLQSRVLGGSTRPSDTPWQMVLELQATLRSGCFGAKANGPPGETVRSGKKATHRIGNTHT